MFIFNTNHYYHHIPSFFSACHVSLSLQVNAAVSFQNNLAIESTNTSSQAMTQHRSSVSKQQLSDNFREPSFEVYELSVSDLGIVFHSWKTLNKGGE